MAGYALPGSQRQLPPGVRAAGSAEAAEQCRVSVVMRRATGELPAQHLTREDFARRFGARPEDVAAVRKFAAANRLAVAQADAARGIMVLSGPVAAFNIAFGVLLQRFEHPTGVFRGRTGPVHLSDELKDLGRCRAGPGQPTGSEAVCASPVSTRRYARRNGRLRRLRSAGGC